MQTDPLLHVYPFWCNRCFKSLSCHCSSLLSNSSDSGSGRQIWHTYSQVSAPTECSDASTGYHLCHWFCIALYQGLLGLPGKIEGAFFYFTEDRCSWRNEILFWEKSGKFYECCLEGKGCLPSNAKNVMEISFIGYRWIWPCRCSDHVLCYQGHCWLACIWNRCHLPREVWRTRLSVLQ